MQKIGITNIGRNGVYRPLQEDKKRVSDTDRKKETEKESFLEGTGLVYASVTPFGVTITANVQTGKEEEASCWLYDAENFIFACLGCPYVVMDGKRKDIHSIIRKILSENRFRNPDQFMAKFDQEVFPCYHEMGRNENFWFVFGGRNTYGYYLYTVALPKRYFCLQSSANGKQIIAVGNVEIAFGYLPQHALENLAEAKRIQEKMVEYSIGLAKEIYGKNKVDESIIHTLQFPG